jgi:hypothetical protein
VPAPQSLSQRPQWSLLVLGSTHAPPQAINGAAHVSWHMLA